MKYNPSGAPATDEHFNNVYKSPIKALLWTDTRIPSELRELARAAKPKTSLELGCGLGRFTTFMAEQGIAATGVDFSSVAIEKAKKRAENNAAKPTFQVGDVTNLVNLNEKFDISYDIGCFHVLYEDDQEKYVSELFRLLNPGSIHLIWALDHAPSDIMLSPEYIENRFDGKFQLLTSKFSRRRLIASHWYWLVRE